MQGRQNVKLLTGREEEIQAWRGQRLYSQFISEHVHLRVVGYKGGNV